MQQQTEAEQQRRRRANEIINFLSGAEPIFSLRAQVFLRVIRRGSVSPRQLAWLESLKDEYLDE
jgi:hypothetical protein